LVPPPNETVSEREVRLKAELDAKKISDSIDDMLHQERSEKKKLRPEVNVLLLGQSESGKSTTLKRKSRSLLIMQDSPAYMPMDLLIIPLSSVSTSLDTLFDLPMYQNSSCCTLPPHFMQNG
jgi:predicted Ser/Thr protein kinase